MVQRSCEVAKLRSCGVAGDVISAAKLIWGGIRVSIQTSILPRHFRFAAAKLNCRGNCPGKTWAEKSGTFAAARITSWAMFNRVSILVVAGPFAAAIDDAKVCMARKEGGDNLT